MNIEEAIKDIKRIINNPEFDYIVLMDSQGFTEWNDILETLLTAYEKEKEKNEITKQMNENLIEALKESISKDKIKEILGIEEDINNEKLLSLLQTIVDENARLEDIEDRKLQIEYNNVFNKGVKSVEDKIKAKIEEYDDKGMTVNLVNRSAGKTFQQAVHYEVKKVLHSLLEKE